MMVRQRCDVMNIGKAKVQEAHLSPGSHRLFIEKLGRRIDKHALKQFRGPNSRLQLPRGLRK